MMLNLFEAGYAEIYDLLYQDKEYESETEFLGYLYRHFCENRPVSHVLDLGCGTGAHLRCFSDHVFKCGVDRSAEMIRRARLRNIPRTVLFQGDVGEFHLAARFDLVYSLFHVLSYQTNRSAINKMLQSISTHLDADGLAIVDFWHRPAWEFDPPKPRMTVRESERFRVVRVSTPKVDFNESTVQIDIDTFTFDRIHGSLERSHEKHSMRAFNLSELELLCEHAGLQIVRSGPWMSSSRTLYPEDWYGWIAIRHMPQL